MKFAWLSYIVHFLSLKKHVQKMTQSKHEILSGCLEI